MCIQYVLYVHAHAQHMQRLAFVNVTLAKSDVKPHFWNYKLDMIEICEISISFMIQLFTCSIISLSEAICRGISEATVNIINATANAKK